MSWLKNIIPPKIKRIVGRAKKNIPEGLWHKCPTCQTVLYKTDLEKNMFVCSNCGFHNRISARHRVSTLLDTPNQIEHGSEIKPTDPLNFKDTKSYKKRLTETQKNLDENDALIVIEGKIESIPAVVAVFEFSFMGGSMGSVVGEKFVLAVNTAIKNSCPLICISASGGARMQEGLLSLMQMAKTSSALTKLKCFESTIYFNSYRSNNGWCFSKFCNVRRYNYCRAKGSYWFCWTKGNRIDCKRKIT